MEKVILVLVDGMRPDAILENRNEFLRELAYHNRYTLKAKTIMPCCTLPCHSSLFFSVDADRHGITNNTWKPLVRPIDSLIDVVNKEGKKAGMFYNWEELRDLNRPGSLNRSYYQRIEEGKNIILEMEKEQEMTKIVTDYIKKEAPDFVFLYLGYTDHAGHDFGWMSDEYGEVLSNAIGCIEKLWKEVNTEYSMVIIADHGGHGRDHGYDIPEDMTIPIILAGEGLASGEIEKASIKDIAPTIAKLLQLKVPLEWEGKALC